MLEDQWDAKLYDTKHTFVSSYGRALIELLKPKVGETVLDLGCGTGDLAHQISECGAEVIGIDQSENMVLQAKQKYPDLAFNVQDATELTYQNAFDAVFSNATLHWIKEPEKVLFSLYNCLKLNGRFVAEFGGKGNVKIITDAIIEQLKKEGFDFQPEDFPWYYPSIGEYTSLMEKAGFRVTYAQHYDRPTILNGEDGLRNWIEMFADALFIGIDATEKNAIIGRVEDRLREKLYQSDKWVADYKRIRVIGIKEL